jgi:hypothetical protein
LLIRNVGVDSMTASSLSCPLHTGDITLMSSADSRTVTGKRVTRIGAVDTAETHCDPTVHLSLAVQTSAADAPEGDDSLGLILKAEDAIELGLSLLVMGLGDATPAEQEVLIQRLKQRQQDVIAGRCSG